MDWNNINEDRDTSGLGPIEYDQSKVPQLIRKHADNVRTKTYGQEVREAQARNAELAGLIASEASSKVDAQDDKIDDLEVRFDNAISGVTVDSEVIDSRLSAVAEAPFTTLKERLDFEMSKNTEHLNSLDDKVDKINNITYLEDNPTIVPETTAGWISRVINNSRYGRVLAKAKKTYYIQTPINITNSDVYIDFNGAVLSSQGSVTNQIEVSNANNVTIENLFIAKTESDTGGFLKATNVTDLTVKDVKGSVVGLNSAFRLIGVSRSKFQNINIKNSNSTKKGIGIQLDYCVNIDFQSVFLEYFTIGALLTDIKSGGTSGYMNEGINFDGLFLIKQNVGMQVMQCTQLNISNAIIDFSASYGFLITYVNMLTLSQFWIGMQDGAVTGFEITDGVGVFVKMGTIAGDWNKQASQKAFYAGADIPMTIDGVYMIDVHGGNLNRSKIEVTGDYYFHSGQSQIVKYEYGTVVNRFVGQTSVGAWLNKSNMYFTIYSFDQNNKINFVKSEGYQDSNGVIHINKIASNNTGNTITHVVHNNYNIKLESTYGMSNYMTIVVRHIDRPSPYKMII